MGGAGSNPAWSTDLTYSSPTLSVPDAFVISSAGSIALTAGGSNKAVTITSTGTGNVVLNPSASATTTAFATSNDSIFATALGIRSEASGSMLNPAILSYYYENGQTGGGPFAALLRAGGTIVSPSNSVANTGVMSYVAYAYANGGFRRVGGMNFTTGFGFSNTSYESRWTLETTIAGATARTTALLVDEGGGLTVERNLSIVGASVVSLPAESLTGAWFTGGTATTTKPHFLIEPTGTTSTNWSTSGTGLGINAASGFAGNLLDIQIAAVAKMSLSSASVLTLTNGTNPSYIVTDGTRIGLFDINTSATTVRFGSASPHSVQIMQNGGIAITINTSKNVTMVGTLTTIGGATFHTTSSALTDGAGAQTATFTNAPVAGNPSKWIGINDNGTTRYIPAF